MLVPSRTRLREWWDADAEHPSPQHVSFWTDEHLDAIFETGGELVWVALFFALIAVFGADMVFSGAIVVLFAAFSGAMLVVVVAVAWVRATLSCSRSRRRDNGG